MKVFSDNDNLYIKFSLIEKILGVHGSFTIPLDAISEIYTDGFMQLPHGVRFPGTFFPGLIKAGTYLTNRGKEFWHTTRNKEFLRIELRKGFYKRIIISIDENESIKNEILKRKNNFDK